MRKKPTQYQVAYRKANPDSHNDKYPTNSADVGVSEYFDDEDEAMERYLEIKGDENYTRFGKPHLLVIEKWRTALCDYYG